MYEEEQKFNIETLVSIYTVEKGVLKVLLMRKKTNPYKGYWVIPAANLSLDETLEDCAENIVSKVIGLKKVHLEQDYAFSGLYRDLVDRLVGISYIGLIDSKSAELKKTDNEFEWFSINDIPKMGYDHEQIIAKNIELIRKKVVNSNFLKKLFPSDFTLPEIQRFYEQILNKKLDRRNFSKKFINLGLVIDTGYKNEKTNGRPGKLYRLNDNVKERDLF